MPGITVKPHKRKEIRDAVVALLKKQHESGLYATDCEERVFSNRVSPYFQKELPAAGVFTLTETAEEHVKSPLIYRRNPQVVIEIVHELNESIDDAFDNMAAQVELAMSSAGWYLTSPVDGTDKLNDRKMLKGTDISINPNGEKPTGVCRIVYEMPYTTEDPEPINEENMDDFETGDATYGTVSGATARDLFSTGN
jgi:hypothetical protein